MSAEQQQRTYRLLEDSEVIQEGDQWKTEGAPDVCWDSFGVDFLARHAFRTDDPILCGFQFRRPLPPQKGTQDVP